MTTAPIIVSALFGADDFAWLNGLRQAHFPPERNQLGAHLTLFHHLPPSLEPELKQRLINATRRSPPPATAEGMMNLGRGVAIRIRSPELSDIRSELADAFSDMLIPQDAGGWRAHVTIQNKAHPAEARALLSLMEKDFRPRPVRIAGLAAWWYRGGPWELIARYAFR